MQKAIEDRNLPKVRLLLKAGVPAEHCYHPSQGWTFAKLAARTGDFAIFCCLIDAGADISGREAGGWPMIQEAVYSKNASTEIVNKVLAESHCSQADLDGTLVHAPEYGNLEIVGRLLDAGANPGFVSDDGANALMHAVMQKNSAIAIRLLEAGADPTLRVPYEESYKKTIIELASDNQMHDFLRACGSHAPESKTREPAPHLTDSVNAIEKWFEANAPTVILGPPRDTISLPALFRASAGFADVTTWFALHDGSNGIGVVPMPDDISYYLMTLDESLREREMMLRLFAEEGHLPDAPPAFWRATWLPIASNGAGDYLVWDATTASVLRFSHESRQVSLRAPSLPELFQDIASGLLTGKYTYSEARGVA
jgi:hypothetical protein